MICLTPNRFRLRFYTAFRVKHRDRAVEHAQGALNFDRKIHVTGRVDNIDTIAFPVASRRRGRDRNPAFLFLVHPVHGSGTFVCFTDFVHASRVKQNTFRGRGLAGINVCHDADVASIL